ncbi:MAG: elongation factor P [Anaerolineae bacterium]|nr:elongation factor P [Anaerolineae bacterium]
MIDVNALRKGVTFTMDGELYKVLSYQHHKPGRGNATIRTTLRNLRTGATIQHNFISGDRVEDVRLESRPVEYLYQDGDMLIFMDTETYDQPAVHKDVFGDDARYLTENMELKLLLYEDEVIDYELPNSWVYEVVDSEVAVAGDTATGATKKVTTQTGLQVVVPLFVEVGDKIKVNTETGAYITRA